MALNPGPSPLLAPEPPQEQPHLLLWVLERWDLIGPLKNLAVEGTEDRWTKLSEQTWALNQEGRKQLPLWSPASLLHLADPTSSCGFSGMC